MFMLGPETKKKDQDENNFIGVCFGDYSESESGHHGGFSSEDKMEYERLAGETNKQFFLRVVESSFLKFYNQEKEDLNDMIESFKDWGMTEDEMLDDMGMTPKGLKQLKLELGFRDQK